MQVNAAGSLTNTLLALCRVGQAATQAGQGQQLSIAAACLGGDDALGFFYRRQLENTGVELLTEPQPDSHTGMLRMVLFGWWSRSCRALKQSPIHLAC